MPVIRVNKNKNFTVMSNHHLQNVKLSLKAKGLLSQMLSLPENWDYSIAGLVGINPEKESAIYSTLNELKQLGYLEITKLMPNQTRSGRIEYIYDVYEIPKQEVKKQDLENQGLEIQALENQGQLNTNNKVLNNKVLNKTIKKKQETKQDPEIKALIESIYKKEQRNK